MKPLIVLLIFFMIAPREIFAQKKLESLFDWQVAGELPASPGQQQAIGFAGPVAGISNDVLLVAGGANFPAGMPWEGGKKKYYADVFAYRIKDNKLQLLQTVYQLKESIAYAAACTTPAGIVYAGGENEHGISNKVSLLTWNEDAQNIQIKELPELPLAVTNAAITFSNHIVYVAGGEMPNAVSNHFYFLSLDHVSAGWKELPMLPVPVSHAVMIAVEDGHSQTIYLAGGRKKNTNGISDLYNKLYAFDIKQGAWTEKKSLPWTLMAGTGIAFGHEGIILFGGDTGKQFHDAEILTQTINQTADTALKKDLIENKNRLQSNHPGFSKTILRYNSYNNEWVRAGEMSFPVQVTTTAFKWKNEVIIPGGEIRAGVRTPLIMMTTMKEPQ